MKDIIRFNMITKPYYDDTDGGEDFWRKFMMVIIRIMLTMMAMLMTVVMKMMMAMMKMIAMHMC